MSYKKLLLTALFTVIVNHFGKAQNNEVTQENLSKTSLNALIETSEAGNAEAQYKLALVFFNEFENIKKGNTSKNLMDRYKQDMSLDLEQALDSLDLELYKKEWVESNYKTWIWQSAMNNNAKAQYLYGMYHEQLPKHGNKILAYAWCNKSAKQGNEEAIIWIKEKNETDYLKQYLDKSEYANIDFYASLIQLSENLCFYVKQSGFSDNITPQIEDAFLKQLNITREDATYKQQLANFWNTYNKFFICIDEKKQDPQHILEYAMNKLFYKHNEQVFNWLFGLNEASPINFNDVIYYDSKPETILDVLQDILMNPNQYQFLVVEDIGTLRQKLIKDYNSKTAMQILGENEQKEYYKSGNLEAIGNIDATGQRTGIWKFYYETGELEQTGTFVNDGPTGTWNTFYKNGQLKAIEKYLGGAPTGGKPTGEWKRFFENGQLQEIGSYDDDGLKMGVWKSYDENKQLKSVENYSQGELIKD